MDTAAKLQDQRLFHLTGRITGEQLRPIHGARLRPALLANLSDLSHLRYDWPVILVDQGEAAGSAIALSSAIDALLDRMAPRSHEGDPLRRDLIKLEANLRGLIAGGAKGRLSELWAVAIEPRAASAPAEAAALLTHAGTELGIDGELLACAPGMPARLVTHAWRLEQSLKAGRFHALVDGLMRELTAILRAAFFNSEAGRQPAALRAAMGAGHGQDFDFELMSRLVVRGLPQDELPRARRARIEDTLAVLTDQRFHADPRAPAASQAALNFAFDNCAAAAAAWRERLPQVARLVKALAIAQLEARGAYVEAEHDPFFADYDETALATADLELLPDYLVCIDPANNAAPENAGLIELLSTGLPVKVLVQFDDLLDEASLGTGHFAFGVRGARLATTAMGLGGMFVLQSTSSNLYALRHRLARGLACRGPALLCVLSPATAGASLPPALEAGAAMDSRAFPAFTYDAAAGGDWASRFSLENNREPEADWPTDTLVYADAALQRVSEPLAFTYADFVLADPRHASHFARVPATHWNAAMLPAAQWLAVPPDVADASIPFVWAVDANEALHRLIVDTRLMQAAQRCVLLWHRLQEHAGIHDSHAKRLLAKKASQAIEPASEPEPIPPPAIAPAPAAQADLAAPSTEAWIETSRCPSCNECQLINDRLFGYNENKQAFIRDITAGTYRQLVEAAESCQVAIIHPGQPRDPKEPGLAELIERARPFL